MDPNALDAWRSRCGFSTWESAADALGLSKAHMSRYKSGQRPIPRIVANACAGVEARLLSKSEAEAAATAVQPPLGKAASAGRFLSAAPADSWGALREAAVGGKALSALPMAAQSAWPAPREANPATARPDLAGATPQTEAIAEMASGGYAYAASATRSRLTKPRGGSPQILSLLTPIPAPAAVSTTPTKKG